MKATLHTLCLSLCIPLAMQGCSRRNEAAVIHSLSSMNQLGLVEYRVRKIIKADDPGEWYKIGDRKILLSCTAYLKAGIDLAGFSPEEDIVIDRRKGKVSITLPHATLLSLDIPSSEIRQEYDQVTLLRSAFSVQERNQLLRQGERQIRRSVPSLGILEEAEANARKFFESAFYKMDFKEVEVTFK